MDYSQYVFAKHFSKRKLFIFLVILQKKRGAKYVIQTILNMYLETLAIRIIYEVVKIKYASPVQKSF